MTEKAWAITNFGTDQGIPGVVVNIHGFGKPERTGNIRVYREETLNGVDICIEIYRHGRWWRANTFKEVV